MATNSIVSNNESNSTITIINDDCPLVLKEFFLNLSINIEKSQWTSKCKLCSTYITDTHKTTSNFIKHLRVKHQTIFNVWKDNQHKRIKDTNQPQINNVFNRDREKCKYLLVLKKRISDF